MRKNNKGFTLIELVLVITILGILAVAALPSFIDVSSDAETSSRDGVIGAVRAGIAMYRANDLVQNGAPGDWPPTLGGSDGAASDANPIFGNVLQQPVTDANWTLSETGTVFTYTDGTAYEYDSSDGSFTLVVAE